MRIADANAYAYWSTVAQGLTWAAPDNIKRHSQMIAKVLRFMVDVADETELTLDPAMDTYYFMDTVVTKMPAVLEQLLRQTNWGNLDYLIVDMPPGTGDIQLTLSQRVPLTGAVIVTTPQDIALLDARKGIKMFEKVGVPILGIVENMAVHICSNCGHAEHIFGAEGGQKMAAQYGTELLGSLPLAMSIRAQADSGAPTVVAEPDGEVAALYKALARKVAVKIAGQGKDYSSKFPTIAISKNT